MGWLIVAVSTMFSLAFSWLAIRGLVSGKTYLPRSSIIVRKNDRPILYWTCVSIWLALGFSFAFVMIFIANALIYLGEYHF